MNTTILSTYHKKSLQIDPEYTLLIVQYYGLHMKFTKSKTKIIKYWYKPLLAK